MKKNECENSYLVGNFGLRDLSCFKELKSFDRLMNVPQEYLKKLSARIYERLILRPMDNEYYEIEPEFDRINKKYNKILSELKKLQKTEKMLIKSGKINLPVLSSREISIIDLW